MLIIINITSNDLKKKKSENLVVLHFVHVTLSLLDI